MEPRVLLASAIIALMALALAAFLWRATGPARLRSRQRGQRLHAERDAVRQARTAARG